MTLLQGPAARMASLCMLLLLASIVHADNCGTKGLKASVSKVSRHQLKSAGKQRHTEKGDRSGLVILTR